MAAVLDASEHGGGRDEPDLDRLHAQALAGGAGLLASVHPRQPSEVLHVRLVLDGEA
jgi:hypothetical protein